eukprot:COSAG02_NODE_3747_length_6292_cov_3.278379_4_plen_430_part_00
MTRRHVAVIGAGAAGLCTAKSLLSHGHTVEIFETQSEVGGTWVLREPPAESSLYESLETNTPKHKTAFPGVPFDDALPVRVPHADVLRYLERYALDVLSLIHFRSKVERIHPLRADQWELLVKGERHPRHFGAVAVCNGHYSVPYVPSLYADANAAGRVIHSHDYRRPDKFAGKRVMVVGAAGSANDIAPEIATVASEVIRAHKSYATRTSDAEASPTATPDTPSHLDSRHHISEGREADSDSATNIRYLPEPVAVSATGSIRFAPNAAGLIAAEQVDLIVLATGYKYRFDFLRESGLLQDTNERSVRPLYRHVFHIDHPSLAFVGLPFKVIPWVLFYIQAEWVARVWASRSASRLKDNNNQQGVASLPSIAAMHAHRLHYEAALSAGANKHPRLYHVLDPNSPYGNQWCEHSILLCTVALSRHPLHPF